MLGRVGGDLRWRRDRQLLVGDVIPNASIDGGRATGFTAHPNDLGALTAIAFVPALMLASRPRIAACHACLLIRPAAPCRGWADPVGVHRRPDRGGCGTVVWLVFQRTSIHAVSPSRLSLCASVALVSLQSIRGAPHPLERFESATTSSSSPGGGTQLGSVDQRIRTYRASSSEDREDPFVGVGLDLFSVTRPFGVEGYEYDVHNLVIGLWYKTGLVGLLGMLLALLAILRSGWTAISESITESERRVAVALGSSVVAFVVFAMTAPILFTRLGWISAALVLALRGVQLERLTSLSRPRARESGVDP